MVKKATTKKAEGKKKVSKMDIALKAIEKKYGNVVKPMSERPLIIDTISTRSIGLDAALGRGGVALGRIYEIYGPTSGGKCVTKDTYVNSEHGLVTIEELFKLEGEKPFTTNKNKEIKSCLRNEKGLEENTSHFVWSNKKPVNYIKTVAGLSIKCTDNHKLRVIDNNTGFISWKKSKDITTSDYLLVNKTRSEMVYEDKVTEGEATFLGMLLAEGSLGYSNKFLFTNEDPEMLSLFSSLVDKLFNFNNIKKYSKDNNTFSYAVHSKVLRELLYTKYGLSKSLAKEKSVPMVIRVSSSRIISKFLSAYFSLDGCYERKNRITASSASRELLKQIQLLLLDRFGIKSKTYKKLNKSYDKYYYHITISSDDTNKFIKNIGFILKNKIDKCTLLQCEKPCASFSWAFPRQNDLVKVLLNDSEATTLEYDLVEPLINRNQNLTSKKLSIIINSFSKINKGSSANLILEHLNLLNNFYACTKVTSIKKLDPEPVFDVVMPETHSFLSNGLISHNTTLAMSIIAEAQSRGMKAVFIDAEKSADPVLFESMGVDLAKLEVIDLYTGEDNLDAAEMIMKSGNVDLLVVDSVTALIPKVQAEKEIGDVNIALLARLMSTTLLRYVPLAAEHQICIIFINQIRQKIGVMFGCFHYDTQVVLEDGKSLPIGYIVDNKIEANVWSYNDNKDVYELKPIVAWHDNGKVENTNDFLTIQTDAIDNKGGKFSLTCTSYHKILTQRGWSTAGSLKQADLLVSKYYATMNGSFGDFMSAVLVCDSTIHVRSINTGCLKLQDSINPEYLEWKVEKLAPCLKLKRRDLALNKIRYESDYTYEFAKIKKEIGQRNTMFFLNNFSALGLALLIMDDGHLDLSTGHRRYNLSIKRFKRDTTTLEEIKETFCDLGFLCNYNIKDGSIWFKTEATDKIASTICRFIPECMSYKLPVEYRNKYQDFNLTNSPVIKTSYVRIKGIKKASDRKLRNLRKFDITVEDNATYMVGSSTNGIVVHNSPETTPAGEALPFYSTGRLRVSGVGAKSNRLTNEQGTVIGHKTKIEIKKNKLAAPFTTAEVDLFYGVGYDMEGEIIKLAVDLGIINKSGSWYSYADKNIGQGDKGLREFFKENYDVFLVIRGEVIEIVGLKEYYDAQKARDKKVKGDA